MSAQENLAMLDYCRFYVQNLITYNEHCTNENIYSTQYMYSTINNKISYIIKSKLPENKLLENLVGTYYTFMQLQPITENI